MPDRVMWIVMEDGVRLHADLYLPPGAGPHPVVLEALPYRKDDQTSGYESEYVRLRDEGGLAVCRLDLRGTGSSEGIATDEYPASEQRDLVEVIGWLAAEPWSNGRVGMYGVSYSGFNSIQVACERPPALAAIVPIYATDDRYHDDVHYFGGALKALDIIDYVHYMTPMNALPPVPAVFGARWRDEWLRRIDGLEPWLLTWLREQHDGPYWRHGSLRPDYGRITCPTMIVAGWADGYRNNTLRTFEQLRCPKRLLIGPWSHMTPDASIPGPNIDLVPELIAWFRRWLCDEDNGIDRRPPIDVFVRHSTRPEPDLVTMLGQWRSEPAWPAERLVTRTFRSAVVEARTLPIRGDVGTTAWLSCAGRLPWGQALDQRPDEVYSLVDDWPVGDQPVEILGHPVVRVRLRSDVPIAYLSAKLCDVFADGTSALVTRGLLNLAHRQSFDTSSLIPIGEPIDVRVELEATSWHFDAGHRVRLDLAAADWPNVWPSPMAGSLIVEAVELELPVMDGPAPIDEAPTFTATSGSDLHGHDDAEIGPPVVWRVEHDVLARRTRAVTDQSANYSVRHGGRSIERYQGAVSVSTIDPGDADAVGTIRFELHWPEVAVAVESRLSIVSDATHYRVELALDVDENGTRLAERRWSEVIERQGQ
jgi:predicted acyl esterase